ncbi:MAG: alkaline phosphatase D family protein [Bacteroidetes bacterium]|nr:alkaline phosphatase D family protein [Bacteroidota bacterium]
MTKYLLALSSLLIICCTPKKETLPKLKQAVSIHFDEAMKPFYHGVASGDPLPDRVIIWTRVTPEDSVSSVPVKWEVAEDESFSSIYQTDTTSASAGRDYTVKVDVDALKPDRVYYYRFTALGKTSIVGRTKTAPVTTKDSLKFAIASCANWEFGYFSAYDKIADRPVLDAVLHLGDYIYEYGVGRYGDTTLGRINIPPYEIVSLQDYRTRYSLYRLDKGLRRVHQQHPFITIWDDHEIANNSTVTGAQNHQPEDGDYEKRKAAAKQTYYEWMPIRESKELYRSFSFGSLADVIMLDERLAGRDPEITDINNPSLKSDERSMLGAAQLQWFENALKSSKATWKVIGNQVIFSDVFIQDIYPKMQRNLDSWDGFPSEKKKLVDFIRANKIQDIVITSGDTHASWAFEAAVDITKNYQPFAVELGVTSISSGNLDERKSADTVKIMEQALLKRNPHIKYNNHRDHGYLLLTLYPNQTKAEWFFVETLKTPESKEFLAKRFIVTKGSSRLKEQ